MVMLHHDYNHINVLQELIKVRDLILCNLMILQEWVVALQRTSKVSLLSLQKLERRRLAIIIHVLLVSQAIQTDTTVVSDAVLLHYLIDSVENKCRLAVVGLHRLINDLGQLGVVTDKEPVTTPSWPRSLMSL